MLLRRYRDRIQPNDKQKMWLPLVGMLLGLMLWVGNSPAWGQNSVSVSSSAVTVATTQADQQAQIQLDLTLTIVSIDAEISQSAQTTQVSIRSIGSSLEELEFQFPVIEFAAIEQAIAQELDLPTTTIHQLIRYRLNS